MSQRPASPSIDGMIRLAIRNGCHHHLRQVIGQHRHYSGIDPPLIRQLLHKGQCVTGRQTAAIRSVLHHCLKNIGDPQDPRFEGEPQNSEKIVR